jgi:hypothetical protein
MKTCVRCEKECVERTVVQNVKFAREHVLPNIEQRYWECLSCGEEFFDMEQSKYREHNMNEVIKGQLGYDWLAECEARRKRWKEDPKHGRRK